MTPNPKTKPLLQHEPSDAQPAAVHFDRKTIQSSFEFKESPYVVFVESTSTLKPTDFYDDLPELSMSAEDAHEQTSKHELIPLASQARDVNEGGMCFVSP